MRKAFFGFDVYNGTGETGKIHDPLSLLLGRGISSVLASIVVGCYIHRFGLISFERLIASVLQDTPLALYILKTSQRKTYTVISNSRTLLVVLSRFSLLLFPDLVERGECRISRGSSFSTVTWAVSPDKELVLRLYVKRRNTLYEELNRLNAFETKHWNKGAVSKGDDTWTSHVDTI